MSEERFRYILAYDVPDDRRRTRLAKVLEGYGDRVQYSLFEAKLTAPLLDELLADVKAVLDLGEDRFHVYALCAGCVKRRISLGKAWQETPPGDEKVFVV